VVKHTAGTGDWLGSVLLLRVPGSPGDPVTLGLAAHVGNSGVDELVLHVRVHCDLSLLLLGAYPENAAKAARRGSGGRTLPVRPAP
jgi:hypothetical protein